MKKLALILPILVLTACDRPTSTAELTCDMDKYWEYVDALYLKGSYSDNELYGTEVNVKVTTYDNFAKVTYENITTTFEKVAETKSYGEFGLVNIIYNGNFPGSERTALLRVTGDITNKKILDYSINFIGEKGSHNEHEYPISRSCTPVQADNKDKSRSTAVSFNHNYKMPNKIERCINEIVQTVYCVSKNENDNCDLLSVYYNDKMIDLSQQDALSISANWGYKNIKLYENDGKIEDYEKDACAVLDRLNKFIRDTGMDTDKSEEYITVQREIANADDASSRVIAEGDSGDFLIKLSETDALRNIFRAEKNAKFLSVSNPNQYAESGYCLINIIPYNTMKKLGTPNNTCNYRIYCGGAESMDYDQYYAVEVCE